MKACRDCGADISKRGNAAKRCDSCGAKKTRHQAAEYREANRAQLRDDMRMSREKARLRASNSGRLKDLAEFISRCKASGALRFMSAENRREAARLKANRAFRTRSRKISRAKKRLSSG